MSYLGSWNIDDVLTFPAITHRVDTGALTDADSVPSYRVYEDETGTAILTGSMAKLDDTNTTGFYSEAITLSAANGFERNKCYTIYITATVNSITGGQHHTFQIGANVNTAYIAGGATSATILNRYWGSGVVTGTADSGTTTTMVDAARTEADADYWKGALLVFTSGNISGQAPRVTDFDPATDTFTFSPATTQAVSTQNYVLIPAFDIPAAVWDEPTYMHAVPGTFSDNVISTTALVALIDTSAVGVATIGGDDPALAIRNAVGLESDNLDTQLAALPTATENATAVWDEQVDGTTTARQSLRLANSANGGKASGMGTTSVVIRDLADTKNRISGTVDADGNRSAVTLDLT